METNQRKQHIKAIRHHLDNDSGFKSLVQTYMTKNICPPDRIMYRVDVIEDDSRCSHNAKALHAPLGDERAFMCIEPLCNPTSADVETSDYMWKPGPKITKHLTSVDSVNDRDINFGIGLSLPPLMQQQQQQQQWQPPRSGVVNTSSSIPHIRMNPQQYTQNPQMPRYSPQSLQYMQFPHSPQYRQSPFYQPHKNSSKRNILYKRLEEQQNRLQSLLEKIEFQQMQKEQRFSGKNLGFNSYSNMF